MHARADAVLGRPCDSVLGRPLQADASAQDEEQAHYVTGASPGTAGISPDASEVDGGHWAVQPSGSPWLRWLRPRASGRRSSGHSTPNASLPRPPAPDGGDDGVLRHDFDVLEDRILQLFADLHRQVASDRHEAERLAELSAARLEAQIGMGSQQHLRLERRATELATFMQSLDEEQQAQGRRVGMVNEMVTNLQASRGQAELDLQRRLSDVEHDQRVLQGATHAAAARDEEAQRRYVNRLRPVEERLSILENEQRRSETMSPPGSGALCPRSSGSDWGAPLESRAVEELQASLMEETRVIHGRCNQMQDVIDNHLIQPMQKLERHVERLLAGDRERGSLLEEQVSGACSTDSRLERHERQLADVRERLERLSLVSGLNGVTAEGSPAKAGRCRSSQARLRPHALELDLVASSPSCPTGATADWDCTKAKESPSCGTSATHTGSRDVEELVRRVQVEFSEKSEQMDWVVRQLALIQEKEKSNGSSPVLCGQQSACASRDRLSELEGRVQENAALTCRLQQFIQHSVDDIKGCIDLAVCSRGVECNGSPGLFSRVDILEAEARNMGEAISELRSEPSLSGIEAGSRLSAQHSPEAQDGLNRLDRFEGLVREIQDHVVVLGKQFDETIATKPTKLNIFDIEPLPMTGCDSEALDAIGEGHMVSWVQADALLRSVEEVVGRQQKELVRLMRHLNLQCLEVAIDSCDTSRDNFPKEDMAVAVSEVNASASSSPGRQEEASVLTEFASPFIEGSKDRTKARQPAEFASRLAEESKERSKPSQSAEFASPFTEESNEQSKPSQAAEFASPCTEESKPKPANLGSAFARSSSWPVTAKVRTKSPGLYGGPSAPWSALAHLSTLMNGFEDAVEASVSAASPSAGQQLDTHDSPTDTRALQTPPMDDSSPPAARCEAADSGEGRDTVAESVMDADSGHKAPSEHDEEF